MFGLVVSGTACADTVNINWKVGDTTYDTTTCTLGGDINLPIQPTKKGYTFVGWLNGTPIEYLESSGTQYINLGIGTSTYPNMMIEIDFIPLLKQTAGICGNPTLSQGVGLKSDGTFWVGGGYNIGQRYRVRYGQGSTVINGQKIGNASFNTASYTTVLRLFSSINYNGSGATFASIKMYFAKIWNGDELVFDFVPALDSRGTPAMYDKVSNTFFYNNGTGAFIAGPVMSYN